MKTSKSACRVIEGRMIKSRIGLKGCQSALLSYCYLFPHNMEPKTLRYGFHVSFWTNGNSENCNCWYLQYSYRKTVIFGGSKKSEVEQVAVPFRTASPGPELVTFSNTKERNGKPIEEKISWAFGRWLDICIWSIYLSIYLSNLSI